MKRSPADYHALQALRDAAGVIFTPDLAGYAASEAAVDLVAHWRICQPPLDAQTQADDIAEVIAVLTRWHGVVLKGSTP